MKVKISISSLINSTRHLTGAVKIITLSLIIITLYGTNTSALTYQDSVDVSFTFDPTLSISLSAGALTIDNLVPGNSARSNTISVDVTTNNVYGYALTAKVGGTMAGASASNALVNGGASFSSLATSDNLILADFGADTWGYTTASSINDNTTTYSGLLYDADTTINMTTGMQGKPVGGYPGTNSTSFTIGASASESQLSGAYTNVISFTVVTNVATDFTINDLKYMQDFANLTTGEKASVLTSMTEGTSYTLTDSRDGTTYTVALMADGNVWMTQNLDLLVGGTYTTESGVAPIVLTSENTDLNQYDTNGDGTGTTFTHYAYDSISGIITWTPTVSTLTGSPATISGTTVTGWRNSNTGPYLAEGGDTYSVQGTRYNSLSACENNGTRTKAQCMHYHVGNYYNFTAAVAMSSTSAYTANNTVMPNSICPKGWRLPNGLTDENSDGTADKASDFNYLLEDYDITGTGGTNGLDLVGGKSVGWATNGSTNIGLAPLYFARSGRINFTSLNYFGNDGYYWSSTVRDGSNAYSLGYDSSDLYPAYQNNRSYGRSVRCMLR